MKRSLAILAASLAFLATNAGSTVPREHRAAASEPAPLPWLLVQDRRMPTCQTDGREVPVGTTYCRQKRLWSCERAGWTDTGKPC